jgi:hypothetical protein
MAVLGDPGLLCRVGIPDGLDAASALYGRPDVRDEGSELRSAGGEGGRVDDDRLVDAITCEKLSAMTCSALAESGLVVRLPSVVNADPIRAPMATTEAAKIRAQAARMRHGWMADTRARYWVNDARGEDSAWVAGDCFSCMSDLSNIRSEK